MKDRVIAFVMLAIAPMAAGTRSFRPDDYYSARTLEDPQISPDGRLVAFTVSSIDAQRNRRLTAFGWFRRTARVKPRSSPRLMSPTLLVGARTVARWPT